jgi:hypothetical protein
MSCAVGNPTYITESGIRDGIHTLNNEIKLAS